MADRLTGAIPNQDLVAELMKMSKQNPDLTLSEAIQNARESIADEQIIIDNGDY